MLLEDQLQTAVGQQWDNNGLLMSTKGQLGLLKKKLPVASNQQITLSSN